MNKKWILEIYSQLDEHLQRVPINSFPAQIGRDPGLTIPIFEDEISRVHAEFFLNDSALMLRDLQSTNGTFVNHQRIFEDTILKHGDVIHFSTCEARVIEEADARSKHSATIVHRHIDILSHNLPQGLSQLQTLIDLRAVKAEFQPIVELDGSLFAFEVLGRGGIDDLPQYPKGLFEIAESLPGKDSELSLLMRNCGVEQSESQDNLFPLFMNTHPSEIKSLDKLLSHLTKLREQFPEVPLVLEIHEDAVTDITKMKKLATDLKSISVDLAYDDFGAGQTRLIEMIEVPVQYIKFDTSLIREIDTASESKVKLVRTLVELTQDVGIKALAEGVENQAELEICQQMGFDLIQGFFFGRPKADFTYINPLKLSA
ncbi:MAG: EAL domain-containing protein [Gammaproteobacteria bacterium]|nr:EAL domain-containing protein [Gammaproteobacteria bacterium]MDH5630668.1 EAL domain-containing protein [Gammaproteobacteria bacterium]